MLLRN